MGTLAHCTPLRGKKSPARIVERQFWNPLFKGLVTEVRKFKIEQIILK